MDDYLIQGGIECDGTSLMPIGTFSHEMGHALGLPDLYDTYSPDGSSEGLGEWDLMGSGNHRRQDAPTHRGVLPPSPRPRCRRHRRSYPLYRANIPPHPAPL